MFKELARHSFPSLFHPNVRQVNHDTHFKDQRLLIFPETRLDLLIRISLQRRPWTRNGVRRLDTAWVWDGEEIDFDFCSSGLSLPRDTRNVCKTATSFQSPMLDLICVVSTDFPLQIVVLDE